MDPIIPEDLVPGVNAPPSRASALDRLADIERERAALLENLRERRADLVKELEEIDEILGEAPAKKPAKRAPVAPRGAVLEAVKRFLSVQAAGAYGAEEIAEATGYPVDTVRSSIRSAIKDGSVERVERGRYTWVK